MCYFMSQVSIAFSNAIEYAPPLIGHETFLRQMTRGGKV